MITFYKRNLKDVSMQKLDNYETFSWINIVDPLEADLQEFAKLHELDFDLLVESVKKVLLKSVGNFITSSLKAISNDVLFSSDSISFVNFSSANS